jgi:hypothetical protein
VDCSAANAITFTSHITLTKSVTIDGTGHNITISGNNATDLFAINGGISVSFKALTMSNGNANNVGGNTAAGGAILNNGTLNVTNCTFSSNTSVGAGGAIANSGIATIVGSTFTGNTGRGNGGGAISNTSSGISLSVANSTFSGNAANVISSAGNGGGAILSNAALTVTNSTFASNSATNATNNAAGGAIMRTAGSATLTNTIVAGNSANVGPDVSGTFTSGGHNLIGKTDGSTGITATGDRTGTAAAPLNPRLGTLAFNGGSVQTIAPLTGSPVIAHGDPVACAAVPVSGVDQRGVARPSSLCAIGAFEPLISAISPSSGGTASGTQVTLTGAGFTPPVVVTIGGVPCGSLQIVNSNTVTCVAGAHAAGTVDVVVTAGTDTEMLPGAYTYGTVNALPSSAPMGGSPARPGPLPNSRPGGGSSVSPAPLPSPR